MAIEYRKLTENELVVFIDMRINQLREEGADEDIDLRPALREYYNRHMEDGTAFQYVYRQRIPQAWHSQGIIDQSRKRSKGVWLRNSPDYGIGYGSAVVFGFWFCEEWKFHAV